MTTISIAMATYNGERFLQEQLKSIAAQIRLPDELVVTDDGSTDRTLEILDTFSRAVRFPVLIHSNSERLGFADNFLKAASLCSGAWVAFCDQDDVWLPHKLQVLEAYLNRAPEDVYLFIHSSRIVDRSLTPIPTLSKSLAYKKSTISMTTMAPWPGFQGMAMTFRSELVLHIPKDDRGFDRNVLLTFKLAHDSWIFRLAGILGKIVLLPDVLCLYRRHGGAASISLNGGNAQVAQASSLFGHTRRVLSVAASSAKASGASALSMARVFGKLANEVAQKAWVERLLTAEQHYVALSEWMSARSDLYMEKSLWRRVLRLCELTQGGRYSAFCPGVGACIKALGKDILITILGARRFTTRGEQQP